jgi:hypothetical protein
MTSAELLAEKANRCLPEGFKAFTCYRLGYEDEQGVWHEFPGDSVFMRIRRDPIVDPVYVVDGMFKESDTEMTDDEFRARIIAPMMAIYQDCEKRT